MGDSIGSLFFGIAAQQPKWSRSHGGTGNCCLPNVRVLGLVVVARLPSGLIGYDPGRVGAGPATA